MARLAESIGACPLPVSSYDQIMLGHGSGGLLTAELIAAAVPAGVRRRCPVRLEDQATVRLPGSSWNHARRGSPSPPIRSWSGRCSSPAATSAGWPSTARSTTWPSAAPSRCSCRRRSSSRRDCRSPTCERIVASMRQACDEAGVALVTGDTKVVDRGKGDQVFITTTGIGLVPEGRALSIRAARPGDRIVVSGTIGDHGIAIMSVREGIEFETVLESDTAPLERPGRASCSRPVPAIRGMRDPTRGGVSSALNELAAASRVGVRLDEARSRSAAEVRAACEMLGLDPLYVANEGKLIAVVPPGDADRLVEVMRAHPLGRQRRDDRRGRGRASRHGHDAVADRRRASRRHAGRRATSEDLLIIRGWKLRVLALPTCTT